MEIVIAGKNRLAVAGLGIALEHFEAAQISVVLSNTSDAERRNFPVLEKAAVMSGVKIQEIGDVYSMADSVFLSLEYDKIVNPALFSTKNLYNLHLSLLPDFRGVATSAWPIIMGRDFAGATLHEIDYGIDTGSILSQVTFPISSDETSFSLHNKLLDSAHQLLLESFPGLISKTLLPTPQSGSGSYFGRSNLVFSDIDLANFTTYDDLQRWFRALYFPIYQLPKFRDQKISAVQLCGEGKRKPSGSWWWSECGRYIYVSLQGGVARLTIAATQI